MGQEKPGSTSSSGVLSIGDAVVPIRSSLQKAFLNSWTLTSLPSLSVRVSDDWGEDLALPNLLPLIIAIEILGTQDLSWEGTW